MKRFQIPALLALIFTLGCSTYLKDRVKDASEILEISGGLSLGAEANLRATKLLQAGIGSYEGSWAGLKEGRFASWEEQRIEMGLFPFFYQELNRQSETLLTIYHPIYGEPGFGIFQNDLTLLTDRGFFEFGVTINPIFFGVDLAFEGAEFADFLLGWFGADLLNDDAYSRSLQALVNQVNSSNAHKRAAAVRALNLRTDQGFGYKAITLPDEFPDEQMDVWRKWNLWLKAQNSEVKVSDRKSQ